MSKKPRFRTSFDSQLVKGCETLLKSEQEHLYHSLSSIWRKLSSKLSLLVISEILRLFVTTLTADGKISIPNTENLLQPIQFQLLKKGKKSYPFFAAFLKSTSNLKHFETKRWPS